MKTVTVELRHSNALKLLKDLELADIIRVLDKDKKEKRSKKSAKFRGIISNARAKEMNSQISKMRNEWQDRNT